MRNILSLILIISLILISGCNSNTKKCHACENAYSQEARFCPNCGVSLISSNDKFESETKSNPQAIDYSDFGFQNNYGMTEWMQIDDFDFSNEADPFVIVENKYIVVNFNNGYLEEREFHGGSVVFSGNRNEGELDETARYNIVSNYVIEIQKNSYPTLELQKVEIINNTPIIYSDGFSYGSLIPTFFIDFARSPEIEQVERYSMVDKKYYTYYICKYYLKKSF